MSTVSDYWGRKCAAHWTISIGILGAFMCYTQQPILLLIGILMIEWNYGGFFGQLPSLLAKRFGDSCLSSVHSMTLSAWGIAGITSVILSNTIAGNTLYLVLALLYFIGFLGFTIFVKRDR